MLSLFSRNPIVYPLGYFGALDGLRGLMTIGVMVAHLRLEWYPGAVVFMDTFFVMSAYLITSLVARDFDRHGGIRFGTFYLRRILRLFPAYYAMLACFLVATFTVLDHRGDHLLALLWSGTYVSNWARAFDWGGSSYLAHTWSLAIEEQYYLLWPLLLSLLARRLGVGWRTIGVVGAVAVGCMLWRVHLTLGGASPMRLYNGFDTRADALLIGCSLGLIVRQPGIPERLKQWRFLRGFALGTLAFFFILGFSIGWEDRALYLVVAFPCSLASALLVASLVAHRDSIAVRFLEFPAFVYLGRICYGLYLWHFPIFTIMRHDFGLGIAWTCTLGVVLTFTMAILSYELIEMPFLRRKNRLDKARAPVTARADATG